MKLAIIPLAVFYFSFFLPIFLLFCWRVDTVQYCVAFDSFPRRLSRLHADEVQEHVVLGQGALTSESHR